MYLQKYCYQFVQKTPAYGAFIVWLSCFDEAFTLLTQYLVIHRQLHRPWFCRHAVQSELSSGAPFNTSLRVSLPINSWYIAQPYKLDIVNSGVIMLVHSQRATSTRIWLFRLRRNRFEGAWNDAGKKQTGKTVPKGIIFVNYRINLELYHGLRCIASW